MDMNAQASQPESQPIAQASPVESEASKAMQKLQKQYFNVSQIEAAQGAIELAIQTVTAANGKVVPNFDFEKDLPEGYEFIVAPINQRDKETNTNKVVGVSIGAVPTYAILMQTDVGQAWILEQTTNSILAKLANAVRPNGKGEIASSIPFTVEDFLTSNRAEGVLVAYRKFANKYVKALKEKGFNNLIEPVFRQVLCSSAFAEQTFPTVPQTVWENIIINMIKLAEKEGMIAGMLVDWRDTRNTAGLPEVSEIDVAGLEALDI